MGKLECGKQEEWTKLTFHFNELTFSEELQEFLQCSKTVVNEELKDMWLIISHILKKFFEKILKILVLIINQFCLHSK